MEKLFKAFDAVGMEEWVDKIYADLKGKSPEILVSQPERELKMKAFYHREEASDRGFSTGKSANSWKNRRYYQKGSKNKDILNDLNEGIDCIGIEFTNQEAFNHLTEGVLFEHVESDVHFSTAEAATTFTGHPRNRLNFDIFALGLINGKWHYKLSDFLSFFDKQSEHQCIWVSGDLYGTAGASTVQELAFACNHLNEYIQLLTDKGVTLEEINQKIVVELSVNEDYFVNIAKLKVFRKLVSLIFSAYDPNYSAAPITLYVKTSQRFLAQNDKNNNLLRQTTQAMSAVIGGCDVLNIQTLPDSSPLYQRMAKNISLLLKEESYLDKVADVAEGAYFMDQLCAEIESKSWDLFKNVEKMGGLIEAVNVNYIQNEIAANQAYLLEQVTSGEKTFLGVNKYPSSLEKWKTVDPSTKALTADFKALQVFRVEEHYKTSQHEQSKV
ncbi:MAG: methylmalonyl-CoA mutase family protein [Crocinitomicaceae bacterium]